MTRTAVVVSVNVGLPHDVPWQGSTVHTGAWKHPVTGPVLARRLNLDGDGQGDLAGHGGEQRAVLVYQTQSYRHWAEHFGRDDLDHGSFGENLTVDGLADNEVCIGDRYRIGGAEFEVTQPRVTCYRAGLCLGEATLAALLVSHRRPGFYFRVIREGRIQAGDAIVQTATGPGALTVADTDALLYLPGRDPDKLRIATTIPAMSPGWKQSFRDLLRDQTSPANDPEPAWPGFRQLVVMSVVPESSTVSSVRLADPGGTPLPAARPGQYLTLRLPEADDPAPVRNYSLSSAPDEDYRISVKREPRGTVSTYLTTRLRPGAVVDVAAPRGEFVLEPGPEPVLLVSGGIGVTPLLAMLHDLAVRRSDREIWWIHGAAGPREHALAAEAHALLSSLPNAREHVFYSRATAGEREQAHATAGRITRDTLAELAVPVNATAYVCGPTSFTAAMSTALTAIGIDRASVHTELFGPPDPINPGLIGQISKPAHEPAGPPGTGPTVTFARSRLSIPFPDTARSLLDLAEACDVPARWSCRSGVCHLCVTPLLAGEITYSPPPLEVPRAGQVLVCCGRPDTDITLDM